MDPINLQIKYLDGTTKDVSTGASDLIAFESRFDMSIVKLNSDLRLTHLFYLGWHCESRTGATTADFEKWCELVAGVDVLDPKELEA
jgi:hypothetical protein